MKQLFTSEFVGRERERIQRDGGTIALLVRAADERISDNAAINSKQFS